MVLILALTIVSLCIIAIIAGNINLNTRFKRQSNRLLTLSKDVSHEQFRFEQLIGLPAPVQRYLKHVLKEGQPYIKYVRMTHNGQFKTGLNKPWISIKGEQFSTTQTPGFIWKGTTAMFTAQDMYVQDSGRLVVSLLSLFNIIDAKGQKYNEGELLRWLGESILYPTNLLPSTRLKWFPIDAERAKLTFDYKGLSLFFMITFNEIGEITEMETERYMGEDNLETWVIKANEYREMNGVVIPSSFEVLWRLEKGDFSYAKFNIQTIVYNANVVSVNACQ